jgi:uncharacterized protein (TIGR00725 family)
MKTTIGVMGSSVNHRPEVNEAALAIGNLIAKKKAVLITGATTGLPLLAAKGAKEAGGEVLGFSPASSKAEHQQFGLPLEHHDLIIYTGLTYKGRNLLNIRASDGIIFIGGSMGTLNEFTIAYDEEKVMGILEGSGGFCDHMRNWIEHLAKPGNRSVIHYHTQPAGLVESVFRSISSK